MKVHEQSHGTGTAIAVASIGALGVVLAAILGPIATRYFGDTTTRSAPVSTTQIEVPAENGIGGAPSFPTVAMNPTREAYEPIFPPPPDSRPSIRFTSDIVNLRSGPSTESTALSVLPAGTEVALMGQSRASADGAQ